MAVIDLHSPTRMSEAERAVRVDLAASYRLVAMYGWDDLIFTRIVRGCLGRSTTS